jgi:hypothetical protein
MEYARAPTNATGWWLRLLCSARVWAFVVSPLLLCATSAVAPAPTPEAAPAERRQFALFGAGTAAGVVGLGGFVMGLVGLDRSLYGVCETTDEPGEDPTPANRCFTELEYSRKHRNAEILMIAGMAGGGALILSSAALITAGLVIRRRRLSAGKLSFAPALSSRGFGATVGLRF